MFDTLKAKACHAINTAIESRIHPHQNVWVSDILSLFLEGINRNTEQHKSSDWITNTWNRVEGKKTSRNMSWVLLFHTGADLKDIKQKKNVHLSWNARNPRCFWDESAPFKCNSMGLFAFVQLFWLLKPFSGKLGSFKSQLQMFSLQASRQILLHFYSRVFL